MGYFEINNIYLFYYVQGEFGNEGSGGQSYLIYPWIAGQTYKVLVRAQPNESANTTDFTGKT